jgi:hypothetical protein
MAKGASGLFTSLKMRWPASANCDCALPKNPNKAKKSNRFTISEINYVNIWEKRKYQIIKVLKIWS